MSMPNYMVFDIEAATLAGSMKNPAAGGIACMCGQETGDPISGFSWLLDATRLPGTGTTYAHAMEHFDACDGVVTWNGIEYDDKVLAKLMKELRKTYTKKPHIDLMAVCSLLSAKVHPDKVKGLKSGWANLVPTLGAEYVQTGWSLNAVAKATLGIGKMDGPQGKQAVEAWMQGRYSEVVTYCMRDVAITRLLYIHAWEEGWLDSEERDRVHIPREVLIGA